MYNNKILISFATLTYWHPVLDRKYTIMHRASQRSNDLNYLILNKEDRVQVC